MILPERVFGQFGSEQNVVGAGDCADFVRDMGFELPRQFRGAVNAFFEGDKSGDGLAFDFMGAANHGGFGDGGMVHQSRLQPPSC